MGQFDWGTEEEHESVWDPETGHPPDQKNLKLKLAYLVTGLIVVGLLLTAWIGGRRLVNSRIDQAEEVTSNEVLASYRLIREASQENDPELLANLISGRDPRWVRAQQQLSRQNLWYDRPVFGLSYRGEFELNPPPPTITLASDLNSATVESILPYEYGPNGEAVKLIRTEIYRRGENGWLLSPLDSEYWRSTARFDSPVIEAVFPLADQEIGAKLTRDLSQMIVNLCDLNFELNCPDRVFPIKINFTLDPDTLVTIQRSSPPSVMRPIYWLPSPTLIGRPTDEEGYRAMFDGYSRYLFFSWLQNQEEFFWGSEWRMAQTATQIRFHDSSPVRLLDNKAQLTLLNPQVDHSIALLCLKNQGTSFFKLSSNGESSTLIDQDFLSTSILVDSTDSRLALQGVLSFQEELRLWPLDIQETPLVINYPFATDDFVQLVDHPQGARLMIAKADESTQETAMISIDCGPRSCQTAQENMITEMSWSPDGRYTAAVRDRIFLGDNQGTPILYIAQGYSAHWVNSQILRYLAPYEGDDGGSSRAAAIGLWEYNINRQSPELITTAAELHDALPEEAVAGSVALNIWTAIPLDNDRTLLFTADQGRRFSHFVYDHQTDDLSLIWSEHEPQLFSFLPSPDGQYLLQNILENGYATLKLYDLKTGDEQPIGRHSRALSRSLPETIAIDWSQDSRQILIVAEGQVMVYDLENETLFNWPLPDSHTGCFDGRWVKN